MDFDSLVADPSPEAHPSSVSAAPGSFDSLVSDEDKYGGTTNQIKAGLEGAAQGVIGPLAPAIERAFGAKPEDIRGRALANPITHAAGEAAGFAGSLLVPGVSELGLAGQVGNIGEHAAALLPEAASVIARTGIKASAEMAALQTSNELSKMVLKDPSQTIGSAAINIGLSGVIGGAGGAALGSVSSLWNKAKNVSGVEKLVGDYMAESQALQQAKLSPVDALGSDVEAIPASKGNTGLGVKLARWVDKNGSAALAKAFGETVSSGIGGGLGFLFGHPIAGAWAGEKTLAPIITSLAKPFAESAVDGAAAKAAVDYLSNVVKGQNLLNSSVAKLFGAGSEVIAKDLIPDQGSRDQLQKSIDFASNPQNAIHIGGQIGHYLPNHATAAAEVTAQATNLLNSMKPKQPVTSPLDVPAPIDKAAQASYNRALDIAQQPLLALQHVKRGTLLPQDVTVLRSVYPALHDAMISKISDQLIQHKADGNTIPYSQRVSMNLLLGGNALDSTMTPSSMQAIMQSASPQSQAQAQQMKSGGSHRGGGASAATLGQINKVNALYPTNSQSRQIRSRK